MRIFCDENKDAINYRSKKWDLKCDYDEKEKLYQKFKIQFCDIKKTKTKFYKISNNFDASLD